MNLHDALASAGIPRIDAEILLAHVLGKNRAWLIAHDRDALENADARSFEEFVHRRNAGEPTAYITGTKEFYGQTFRVTPDVLIPRSCTEELVTTALHLLDGKRIEATRVIDEGIVCAAKRIGACNQVRTIVDIGTGSGCIAITLACERPDLRCIAIDVSDAALDVAQQNARALGVEDRIDFRSGSALEPLGAFEEPFLIVTNPPYVTNVGLLANDVLMHEPRGALLGGGNDGGDILRMIVKQAAAYESCRGIIAECLAAQTAIITDPRPT